MERKLVARWHSFYFDTKVDDRGAWVRITETRPNGYRQSILVDADQVDQFGNELLKAVSEISTPGEAHSASAVRPRSYAAWSDEEDAVLLFLYKIGASISELGHVLQRERGAIRSRLKHIQEASQSNVS